MKTFMKIISNKKAFTLSEVLVTVAIIGALAAIGIPNYNTYRYRARRSEALTAVGTITKNQRGLFANQGSYDGFDNWPAGVSRGLAQLGGEVIFNPCPAGRECGLYNYSIVVGGSTYTAARRLSDTDVNGLWPPAAGWTIPADHNSFVILARGDIFPDSPPRQGDVVFYDSRDNEVIVTCDDIKETPTIPSCQW